MSTGQNFEAAAREAGRLLRARKSNMPSFVETAIFLIFAAISIGLASFAARTSPGLGISIGVGGVILSWLLAASIKIANQWERGIVLRLGEFQSIRGPGVFFIVPIVDRVRMVDTRVLAADIPRQEVITRDNVPVSINGALFFKVDNVEDAVMKIQDYVYGISLLAQTALRDVVGGMVLDELLSERERIGRLVEGAVEKDSQEWGLHVTGIRLIETDHVAAGGGGAREACDDHEGGGGPLGGGKSCGCGGDDARKPRGDAASYAADSRWTWTDRF
jgi:hypothetical protein